MAMVRGAAALVPGVKTSGAYFAHSLKARATSDCTVDAGSLGVSEANA